MRQILKFSRFVGKLFGVPLIILACWSLFSTFNFILTAKEISGNIESIVLLENFSKISIRIPIDSRLISIETSDENLVVGQQLILLERPEDGKVCIKSFWSLWGPAVLFYFFGGVLLGWLPLPRDEKVDLATHHPQVQVESSSDD